MNKTDKTEMHPDSPVDQATVRAEVTHYLFAGSTLALAAGGILAALLTLALWGSTSSSMLVGWLVLTELVYLARFVLSAAYRRSAPADALPWLNRLRLGVAVTGVVWGGASLLLFPSHDPVHQAVLSFALAGLAAGAVTSYAIDLVALFSFLLPALLPLIVKLFAEGTASSTQMGVMVVFFLGFVFMNGRSGHRTMNENIRLRIGALQREEALHVANERLTALIKALPDAIVFKDGEGRWLITNETAQRLFCLNEFGWQGKTEMDMAMACPELCTAYEACQTGDEKAWNTAGMILVNERIRDKDGQNYDYEIRKVALFDVDGRRKGLVVVARDVSERQRTAQRERSRNQVLELLARGAPLTEILQSIVSSVEQENAAMICSILLMDNDGKHLLIAAAPGLPDFYNQAVHGMEIGNGMGSCGISAIAGERIIVEDIQTHPYWASVKELAARASLRACWSEPIRSAAGKVLGTFAIYHHEPHKPSGQDIQLIEQSANLAAIAIERSRANEELQLASMFYQNCSEAMMVSDSDGAIITINPAFTTLTGYTQEEVLGKNPRILSSGHHDQSFFQAMWQSINTTGQWKGEIWNRRKNGEIYAEWLAINTIYDENGLVHRHVALFSDITEDKELIWRQANYDALTELPNRRMFYDRLNQEMRKAHRAGLPLALMYIDLDRFKEVNDTLGHDMGDLLLKDAAQRVSGCVRETDTVARLGGDEFTIILGELDDPGIADRVAQEILKKLAEPFNLGEEMVYLSASIGITMYPDDATDVDALLKHADQAMYSAKQQGRNRCNYFTKSMQEAALASIQIARDLRNALADQQFRVLYQPMVDLATGAIHKAEALICWQHPTRGLISPNEFIPIAEDTGLIVDIGDWVFREAARQAVRWRAAYHPEFQISVNKSPVQFQDENNCHIKWFDYLAELGLPGQSIVVEITEGLLLGSSTTITNQLLEFRDAGMQVSLDDFGTGYSSLSYLKKFDIDYLKIDQFFVSNLRANSDDMALCEAIIVMAHKLGIMVIAEGVETTQQRDLLAAAGCDYGQGYLFARPLPSEEFEALLKSNCTA